MKKETATKSKLSLLLLKRISALIEEQELTKEELFTCLRQMEEIRGFEEQYSHLLGRAVLKRSFPPLAGEEAVAVGANSALRDDDLIYQYPPRHGHAHGPW